MPATRATDGTSPPSTTVWDAHADHCVPATAIADALATVELTRLGDSADELAVRAAVADCPTTDLSDARSHLRRAANAAGAYAAELTDALDQLELHWRGTCTCKQLAWDRHCDLIDARLQALTPRHGDWALTQIGDERHTFSHGAYQIEAEDILSTFNHWQLHEVPLRLEITWGEPVIDATFRRDHASPALRGQFEPLSEDQADLAAAFDDDDGDGEITVSVQHRAVAVSAAVAAVAAALVRGQDQDRLEGLNVRRWESTAALVQDLEALQAELTEAGWQTVTALVGHRWPGTPQQLRAAALALHAPAALHA